MIFLNLIKGKILCVIFLERKWVLWNLQMRARERNILPDCAYYLFVINDEMEVLKGQVQLNKL